MANYSSMDKKSMLEELDNVKKIYNEYKSQGLKLDMSRGKPCAQQLDLSMPMLDVLNSTSDLKDQKGLDVRNYGELEGISEAKKIFAKMMQVDVSNVIVGGNSSLNMMFDTISFLMMKGIDGCEPWIKQEGIKFLCPAPGYDRHFAITQYFGIEMINIPMTENGPDMDMVEDYVNNDEKVKGIWCVPKYSNPQGITYSDETVTRFAKLKPAAKDFRIMWDNAYCIHDITDTPETLLSIMDECKKYGNEDLPIIFSSTSKITFSGAGIAAMAASSGNLLTLKKKYGIQTIGYDKINMLRHTRFFGNYEGVLAHMAKHKAILKPRFDAVLEKLDSELNGLDIASWRKPNGGYFVSVDVLEGCAKRVIELCKEAGVVMTSAGATYPYGKDPKDSNIRVAPTYPSVDELAKAMDIFCICVKYAALEKLSK